MASLTARIGCEVTVIFVMPRPHSVAFKRDPFFKSVRDNVVKYICLFCSSGQYRNSEKAI